MTEAPDTARAIIAQISGRTTEGITAEMRLADLGVDSLGRLMLAVMLEERTGTTISDAILRQIVTVADLEMVLTPARSLA